MIHSPDHLIFLSTLIQLQKMIYIYLCYEFNYPFSLNEEEKLKIWPTNISIDMPKMITKSKNISHTSTPSNSLKTSYKCKAIFE